MSIGRTIHVNRHDIYHEVHGSLTPATVPVLLLHGGAMHIASTFGMMIPHLAQDHVLIGVEQEGHGHTPIHDQPISLAGMRRDTLGVLDALGVRRAHVVGFSAGGMLGIELAVHAPDRVASLTAISASQSPDGFHSELVRMQREQGFQPSAEMMARMPPPEAFARMQADVAAMNPGGPEAADQMFAKMGAFIATDWGWSDDQLAAITAPTLLAIGDRDFIRPDHALHMADLIPGAWLAILPDTLHDDMTRRPELLSMVQRRIASVVI